MTHLIDKDALVMEIKKLKAELPKNRGYKRNAYNHVLHIIDSLEVKEADEEPVSKDYRERYKRIAQSESFKEAYDGKSISEEEPVSIDFEKELYKAFGQVKDFTLGMRIAKWFYDMGKNSQEPVSEDLENAGKEWLRPQLDKYYKPYGDGKMMELTRFDGYAMLDAIEFGAKWQKEKDQKK